jgi:hypothetical protein
VHSLFTSKIFKLSDYISPFSSGFSVIGSVVAQMTGDNATMSGNMTGGNVTGGNMTGSISSLDYQLAESDLEGGGP